MIDTNKIEARRRQAPFLGEKQKKQRVHGGCEGSAFIFDEASLIHTIDEGSMTGPDILSGPKMV
jgi:hypothetical protein